MECVGSDTTRLLVSPLGPQVAEMDLQVAAMDLQVAAMGLQVAAMLGGLVEMDGLLKKRCAQSRRQTKCA